MLIFHIVLTIVVLAVAAAYTYLGIVSVSSPYIQVCWGIAIGAFLYQLYPLRSNYLEGYD